MRLEGKVAIITGAGSGIGQGIAMLFAQEGATVVVAEFKEDRGRETVHMIERLGGKASFVQVDVSCLDEIDHAVQHTINQHKKIDILVNNAGVLAYMPFFQVSEKGWDRLMNVNMKGSYFFAQKVAKEMIRGGIQGSIINMGSIASELAIEFQSHYVASKGGVRLMTKGIALELAEYGIRCNAIAPGIIVTDMTREDLEEPTTKEEALKKIPLNRLGTPMDVAKVALFLASEDSSYITGTLIFASGGFEISV